MLKPQSFHFKSLTRQTKLFVLIYSFVTFLLACSTRHSQPEISPSGTMFFPGKKSNAISVDLQLGRKIGKKTGLPIFEGTNFPIGNDERVFSVATIQNYQFHPDKKHMFHIEWLNNNNKVIYRKYFYDYITDSTNLLSSSISTAKRSSGKFNVRIFYFRELVALKSFHLIPEKEYYDSLYNHIGAKLTFCRKVDKQTGERIGIDTVFYLGKKRWVSAVADFKNKPMFADEMTYRMVWIDPDGQIVYNKLLKFDPANGDYTVKSSFSLKPEKRKPGIYKVNLYFFKQLIATGRFTVKPEEKQEKSENRMNIGPITITLYRKIDKTSGEKIGHGQVFRLEKGEKVYAHIDISKSKIKKTDEITIRWINPENKSFFNKQVLLSETESLADIVSSISIDPEKRHPGKYKIRIVYKNKIVAEKSFTLLPSETNQQ